MRLSASMMSEKVNAGSVSVSLMEVNTEVIVSGPLPLMARRIPPNAPLKRRYRVSVSTSCVRYIFVFALIGGTSTPDSLSKSLRNLLYSSKIGR